MKKLLLTLALLSMAHIEAYSNTRLIKRGQYKGLPHGSYVGECKNCTYDTTRKVLSNCSCYTLLWKETHRVQMNSLTVPSHYTDIAITLTDEKTGTGYLQVIGGSNSTTNSITGKKKRAYK